jgi:hypothetical protein
MFIFDNRFAVPPRHAAMSMGMTDCQQELKKQTPTGWLACGNLMEANSTRFAHALLCHLEKIGRRFHGTMEPLSLSHKVQQLVRPKGH